MRNADVRTIVSPVRSQKRAARDRAPGHTVTLHYLPGSGTHITKESFDPWSPE